MTNDEKHRQMLVEILCLSIREDERSGGGEQTQRETKYLKTHPFLRQHQQRRPRPKCR